MPIELSIGDWGLPMGLAIEDLIGDWGLGIGLAIGDWIGDSGLEDSGLRIRD
jgi:hypothetical protein